MDPPHKRPFLPGLHTILENAQVAQTGDLEPVGQTKETHNYVNPAISE